MTKIQKLKQIMAYKMTKAKAAVAAFSMGLLTSVTVFAADTNAVSVINKLVKTFLSIITAAGAIACLWGGVQLAMGFHSQDGTQKMQGVFFLVGGILMVSLKTFLTTIGVTLPA